MPSYELEPQAFTAPTQTVPYMTVTFRVPSTNNNADHDPIYPATGLQFSFQNNYNHQEAFMERLTSRDLGASGGVCVARIPESDIIHFNKQNGGPPGADQTVVVKMHAWKGEKWLGSWEVGRLS